MFGSGKTHEGCTVIHFFCLFFIFLCKRYWLDLISSWLRLHKKIKKRMYHSTMITPIRSTYYNYQRGTSSTAATFVIVIDFLIYGFFISGVISSKKKYMSFNNIVIIPDLFIFSTDHRSAETLGWRDWVSYMRLFSQDMRSLTIRFLSIFIFRD